MIHSTFPLFSFLAIVFFLSFASTALGQNDPCAEAVLQYRSNNQTFQSMSSDCRMQAGYHPQASLGDCISVDSISFISTMKELTESSNQVCMSCGGVWPRAELGPGVCNGE